MDHWELYEPHDDSFLLAHCVKRHAYGRVLDMGTGSGIQAKTAADSTRVTSVLAVDINPRAITACKALKHKKITCKKSDLFSTVKGTFDTIIFNPPYLPQERDSPIIALEGGKHGHEVIERFLNEAGDHLTPDGHILLVYSTHSKPAAITDTITRTMMHARTIATQQHFFEELIVQRIRKDRLRQTLERDGVTQIRYLARGKRGLVLRARYHRKTVAIKIKNPQSAAIGRIANEAKHLAKLNTHGIGPTLLTHSSRHTMYTYADGPALRDWIRTTDARSATRVLANILTQCRTMDTLSVTKEEMHRPHKHAIITKKGPVLIDFERCHTSNDPKNVTQFCQYIRNHTPILAERGLYIDTAHLEQLARQYARDKTNENFERIKREVAKN